jgi:plasmid maintenance system antidote protein VapI
MTGNEYRDIIARLGLTQTGAAHVLGVHPRTSRKWACDERSIPEMVAVFLKYLLATRQTPAFARLMKNLGLAK